jgi:hypothetical protein
MKSCMVFLLGASFLLGCSSSSSSIFQKPADAVVLTQWVVVNKGMPILAAFHSAGDEEWMFFADTRPIVDVQVSVTLEDLIKLDDSLRELSDLPAGWKATRERKGAPWIRQVIK